MSRITRSASAPSGTASTKLRLDLGAERTLHRLPRLLVLEGPAGLADRGDIDEAHLQRFGRGRRERQAGEKHRREQAPADEVF